jgi:DNA polymerase/3'-5' exonuclease PolX
MSDKKKHDAAAARAVAVELVELLAGACEASPLGRTPEIAGSLRRGVPQVGDIELLFIPSMESRQVDFFSTAPTDLAAEKINRLVESGVLTKRLNVRGSETWGPKNKHAVHKTSGIPVDLFATTLENFWVSLVIRTGSKETNLRLTMGANKLGRNLNAYGAGITESNGHIIVATSERHVFELCGEPYLEPKDR